MTRLPGVGGTLFPGRYLAERLAAGARSKAAGVASEQPRFMRWWDDVTRVCGPASGIHAVFDLVAMPLFGRLGYRASHVVFDARAARALLLAPGGARLGLHVLPWAERRPEPWRDLVVAAHDLSAAWWIVLAPPFLSLVDVRGHATRRSVEFRLPDALEPGSFTVFHTLVAPAMFAPERGTVVTRLAALVHEAERFQAAVRADLQHGVRAALTALRSAVGRPDDVRQALTIVYRILFLLFAESRDVVPRFDPIYGPAYSIGALCRRGREDARGLWDAMGAVTRLARAGCRVDHLVVLPLNGRLFARESAPSLEPHRPARSGRRIRARDRAMASALGSLGWRAGPAGHEEISYADLGVEQLGAVYERLLDLLPEDLRHDGPPRRDASTSRAHSRIRKETGTFYTPQPLAEFVVRRTLAPLVAGATPEQILALRVVDPAMGSGAFLVAACRYLAAAYERALIDNGRASATDFDEDERAAIRRLVAERCLAGVDSNPIAVQLARLSIWLTTLARGRPLGFLDHRLRVGNSLVGAFSSELGHVPTGSRRKGDGRLPLFDAGDLESALRLAVPPLAALRERAEDDVAAVRAKERAWADMAGPGSPLAPWRRAADVWCARWFPRESGLPPATPAETRAAIDALVRGDRTLPAGRLAARLREADGAAREHAFFHWDLEFADVFYDMAGRPRDRPGFDAVVGNPPWEMVRGDARSAGGSDDALKQGRELVRAHPPARQFVRFLRESGLYPSCDRGHVNLYQPFVERALRLARAGGRVGLILPWGLASDDGAAGLRRVLLERAGLDTLVGLDNARGLFPIHRGLRFVAAVFEPGRPATEIRARFGVTTAEEIDALPELEDGTRPTAYPVRLTPAAIAACGTRTLRVPDARSASDSAWLLRLARRWPAFGSTDAWRAEFGRELNATEDAVHFGATGLPVIDGKHLEPFRACVPEPARRVAPATAARLLPDGRYRAARLAYRDVAGARNKWTVIAAIVPPDVLTTHTVYCLRTGVPPVAMDFLCGVLNSYVVNAIVRLLMGSHVTTSLVESLPIPAWTGGAAQHRVARLARRLRAGRASADTEPRLQAEVAGLYGIGGAEFRRLLDGFPLVDAAARARAAAIVEEGVAVR